MQRKGSNGRSDQISVRVQCSWTVEVLERSRRSVLLCHWNSVMDSKYKSPSFDFRCFRSNLRFEGLKRNYRPFRIFPTLQNANWAKNKENGQRLLFYFPAHCQTGSKLGYQNKWTPTSLQKLLRSEPKTGFFFTLNAHLGGIQCDLPQTPSTVLLF